MLLYTAQQIRDQEQLWSLQTQQPTYELMQRAGRAALLHIKHHFADANSICIVCGSGNNAGDGYQLAAIAIQEGLEVQLLQVGKAPKPQLDAAKSLELFQRLGATAQPFEPQLLKESDLIVDAILGSGIQGQVRAPFIAAIDAVNASAKPVLALDIPSGLNADSGLIAGVSIRATHTLSFIGCKRGQVTADGKDMCGQLFVNDLGVIIDSQLQKIAPQTQSWSSLSHQLLPRKHNSHKASFGRLLCIGGSQQMGGAALLTAEAALRTGAGYVYSFCHSQHITAFNTRIPEAIVSSDLDWLAQHVEQMDTIVIGPGLGQDSWAQRALAIALASKKPLVVDADGLNLVAQFGLNLPSGTVITPHPGEAKRLVGRQWPDADRYAQISALTTQFPGCAVLLKGAGSIMSDGKQSYVELGGNPGMASAGMGDVLAGITGALMAQGYQAFAALRVAVALHAHVADQLAQSGQWGMLASDIAKNVRQYLP